jgi:hypothetical protein
LLIVGIAVIIVIGSVVAILFLKNKPAKTDYTNMPADLVAAAVGHVGIDENFSVDDYSLVYNNADGTKTMYVFTHPIRYYGDDGKYHIIDNSFVQNNNRWQNKSNEIQALFDVDKLSVSLRDSAVTLGFAETEPALSDIKTILGNKQQVLEYRYKDYTMSAYPTYLGVKIQLDIPKSPSESLQFSLNTKLDIDTSNVFYFQLRDESNAVAALLYQPVLKDRDGKILRLTNGLKIDVDNTLLLDLSALQDVSYPVSLEFTLNMYRKKQADSCVLSGQANDNQYLDNYLYAGYFDDVGESESLVRFETSLYKNIKPENVISAEYTFNGFGDGAALQFRECGKEWASTKITWNTRDSYNTVLKNVENIDNKYTCDVTELLKKWIDGSANSRFGFQIFGGEDGGVIFPSADNGYCSPRLIVNFRGD